MFASVLIYYYVIKTIFLFSLVKIQVQFETMTDHWLFLGVPYTAGVSLAVEALVASFRRRGSRSQARPS